MPLNATDTETERISQTSVGASATILIRGLAASHKLLIFNHHRRPALANPSSHTEPTQPGMAQWPFRSPRGVWSASTQGVPGGSFRVHGSGRVQEVGDVCYVHAQLQCTVGQGADVQGVINVLAPGRIHAADG